MENKINLVELLKDCPNGMELDCASYDNVSFDKISDDKKATYPIFCYITDKEGNRSSISFTENGCESKRYGAKCVIFPKDKTTWEGFVPPCKFKDGDILYIKTDSHNHIEFIIIFKEIRNNHIHKHACFAYQNLSIDKCAVCHIADVEIMRLATEEEKQKLFDAIKENGYKWNDETKTLEKLVVPKFEVGDIVRLKSKPNYIYTIYCLAWDDNKKLAYKLLPKNDKHLILVSLNTQDDYELVPNKFDITTLKPFESRVLVRDNDYDEWKGAFWSHLRQKADIKYDTIRGVYRQCIPYNDDTKHLLGKTNSCDDYYKTWENETKMVHKTKMAETYKRLFR